MSEEQTPTPEPSLIKGLLSRRKEGTCSRTARIVPAKASAHCNQAVDNVFKQE